MLARFAVLALVSWFTVGCSPSKAGVYVHEDDPDKYLLLKPDRSFFLQERRQGFAREYSIDGHEVTFVLATGAAWRLQMRGDTLIDDDGDEWIQRGMDLEEARGWTEERKRELSYVAYVASMKSDLRNLVNAQYAYFRDLMTYTTTYPPQYGTSPGVQVTIENATPLGWHATARHDATTTTCRIYIGDAGGGSTAGNEGEPQCQ